MVAVTNFNFRRVLNYVLPPVDQRMRTAFINLDFDNNDEFEYDLSYAENNGADMVVQSITVDNSQNLNDIDIISDKALRFTRTVKAGEVRVFNIPAVDPSYLVFRSPGAAASRLAVLYIHNFPSLPDSQYVGAAQPVQITPPAAPSFTTTAPAVNEVASIEALAANSDRRYLLIQNNDENAYLFVGFGEAADNTMLKIPPSGSYENTAAAPGDSINLLSDIALTGAVVVIEGV